MPTLEALHHTGFVGPSTNRTEFTAKCEDTKTPATGWALLTLARNWSQALGTHLLLASNYGRWTEHNKRLWKL